ncbi:hypothetical protein NVP1110O_64 [Vibrio phage 1.110.O._10N.261.52.C1]|nr:hypothetical protein NVP1110O_64 [Vibrio phage 1.110.O._10N.261.52.C1]
MDYKELLKKFVQAACDAEGVSYNYFIEWTEIEFTKEEIQELEMIYCDWSE